MGGEVAVGAQRAGRRWLVETDLPTAWDYVRAGDVTPRRWLGSLRGVDELAWFARDDVGPFVAFVRGTLRRPVF